jgi:hypothetical protein
MMKANLHLQRPHKQPPSGTLIQRPPLDLQKQPGSATTHRVSLGPRPLQHANQVTPLVMHKMRSEVSRAGGDDTINHVSTILYCSYILSITTWRFLDNNKNLAETRSRVLPVEHFYFFKQCNTTSKIWGEGDQLFCTLCEGC